MSPSPAERDLLEAFVAGELDVPAAARTRAHIAVCSDCQRELHQLEAERALFHARRTAMPPVCSDFEAIRRRVAAAAAPRRPVKNLPTILAVAASLALVPTAYLAARCGTVQPEQWVRLGEAWETAFAISRDADADALVELEQHYAACLIATPSDYAL